MTPAVIVTATVISGRLQFCYGSSALNKSHPCLKERWKFCAISLLTVKYLYAPWKKKSCC